MNWLNPFRRTLDRLTLYLPLIIFAFLALGSWWLVQSMPELLPQGMDKLLRKDPDYRLEKFTVKSFDVSGRLTREITGANATHFPARQELHIEEIRIYAQNEAGTQFRAQAQKGVSSENDHRVTLMGDAQAVRKADRTGPQIQLRGESLTAWMDEERVISTLPVEIMRGKDLFNAQTMDFDIRNGQYELKGRVRSVLAPSVGKP